MNDSKMSLREMCKMKSTKAGTGSQKQSRRDDIEGEQYN